MALLSQHRIIMMPPTNMISALITNNQYECDGLILGTTLVESEIKQKCQPILLLIPYSLILLQKKVV